MTRGMMRGALLLLAMLVVLVNTQFPEPEPFGPRPVSGIIMHLANQRGAIKRWVSGGQPIYQEPTLPFQQDRFWTAQQQSHRTPQRRPLPLVPQQQIPRPQNIQQLRPESQGFQHLAPQPQGTQQLRPQTQPQGTQQLRPQPQPQGTQQLRPQTQPQGTQQLRPQPQPEGTQQLRPQPQGAPQPVPQPVGPKQPVYQQEPTGFDQFPSVDPQVFPGLGQTLGPARASPVAGGVAADGPQAGGAATSTRRQSRDPNCGKRPSPGKCRAAIPRYYFNPETNQCDCFLYGGCGDDGLDSSYRTLDECRLTCLPDNRQEGPSCKDVFREQQSFFATQHHRQEVQRDPPGTIEGQLFPDTGHLSDAYLLDLLSPESPDEHYDSEYES